MDAASVGGGRGGRGRGGRGATSGPAEDGTPELSYPGPIYNTHERVRQVAQDCKDVREGVGKDGDWLIDLHQRFDLIRGQFFQSTPGTMGQSNRFDRDIVGRAKEQAQQNGVAANASGDIIDQIGRSLVDPM